MEDGHIAILDVGKTLAKVSLFRRSGEQIARVTRPNRSVGGGYAALDVEGIATWLASALSSLRKHGAIDAIIPAGHGAAAAVVRDGELVCPVFDYENEIPEEVRAEYNRQRDPFPVTGSPLLPHGLNLGMQLHWLERLKPGLLDGSQILLWPQYWAWVLSGVAASEVTSLGCHTDLWWPAVGKPSSLAQKRGWAQCLPPLRRADEALGAVRSEWALRTGLFNTQVYCGLHDSNAALWAARAFKEIKQRETTIVSTGTWFVAMRTPGFGLAFDINRLPSERDCLVNVDVAGRLVPSARFMGGRELETLTGLDSRSIDIKVDQQSLSASIPAIVARSTMILPAFEKGSGPFPDSHGQWVNEPSSPIERRAAAQLYAALMTDAMLELILARENIVIEGRFAESEVFVRMLASLRPRDAVYICNTQNDVSFGALRLLVPDLKPGSSLRRIKPFEFDVAQYRKNWQIQIDSAVAAA